MSCKAFAVPKSSRHVYAITYGLACDGSRGSSPRRAQGHAQPGAPPALAARLSHERATAVVTQLAAGGVARERLRSAAYSNRRPLIGVRGGEASDQFANWGDFDDAERQGIDLTITKSKAGVEYANGQGAGSLEPP